MPKISLKAARVNSDLTVAEAASCLNISKSTLIAWENGRSEPRASQLNAIISLYGVPYDGLDFSCSKT